METQLQIISNEYRDLYFNLVVQHFSISVLWFLTSELFFVSALFHCLSAVLFCLVYTQIPHPVVHFSSETLCWITLTHLGPFCPSNLQYIWQIGRFPSPLNVHMAILQSSNLMPFFQQKTAYSVCFLMRTWFMNTTFRVKNHGMWGATGQGLYSFCYI